jgi:ribosomal protein L7/L12
MKKTTFWDVVRCSLEKLTDVSDVLAASIIGASHFQGKQRQQDTTKILVLVMAVDKRMARKIKRIKRNRTLMKLVKGKYT